MEPSAKYYCENCGSPRAKFKADYAYGTVLHFCGHICQIGHWQRGIGQNPLKKRCKTFTAIVAKVSDGDTIWLAEREQPDRRIKVRLRGIDAPEKDQPYGNQATDLLKRLILNREVRAVCFGFGRFGRMLADIYETVDSMRTVQEHLVRAGLAWYFRRYDPKRILTHLAAAERFAKSRKLGLWRQDTPEKPGAYRRRQRRERVQRRREQERRKKERAYENDMEKLGENMYNHLLKLEEIE